MTISTESELEKQITSDPRWQTGAAWGESRPGHPEGKVELHVVDVLQNIEDSALAPEARMKLRVVALVHDTFKNEVDFSHPRTGPNHHATIARAFVANYTDDEDVLEITELHDEAYNSWGVGSRRDDWSKAEARAQRLLERLGDRTDLYIAFYRADNAAGDKRSEPLEWFERLVAKHQSQPT